RGCGGAQKRADGLAQRASRPRPLVRRDGYRHNESMKKTSPLSQQEKAILNQLARYDGNAVIPELLYPAEPRTASQAASFSRCLRRLQRRGLVTLHTFRPVRRGERTDLVSATVPGLAVASQKGPPPPA